MCPNLFFRRVKMSTTLLIGTQQCKKDEIEHKFSELQLNGQVKFEMLDRLLLVTLPKFNQIIVMKTCSLEPKVVQVLGKSLSEGGKLEFQEFIGDGLKTLNSIRSDLVLNGFVDINLTEKELTENDRELIKLLGDSKLENSTVRKVAVQCLKPAYKQGTGALLRKKNKPAIANETKIKPNSVWTINPNDEEEIIDENELLDKEDLIVPDTQPKDCSTKKRACKDCSCGRAEIEQQEQAGVTVVQKKTVTSSCGSVIIIY